MNCELNSETYEYLNKLVTSGVSFKVGINDLINYCKKSCPNKVWHGIQELDFEHDLQSLRKWLEKVFSSEPPKEGITAFWFGLFNPIYEDGKATCGLYVAGSDRFVPEDENMEWACNPVYLPQDRYARSLILHKIYRLMDETNVETAQFGEYVLCLGYACLAIREICPKINSELLLGARESRNAAVGFDSGDSILLGSIRKNGWSFS